jgi:hypothetical protein
VPCRIVYACLRHVLLRDIRVLHGEWAELGAISPGSRCLISGSWEFAVEILGGKGVRFVRRVDVRRWRGGFSPIMRQRVVGDTPAVYRNWEVYA